MIVAASDREVPTTGGVKRTLSVSIGIAILHDRWSLTLVLTTVLLLEVDACTYHAFVYSSRSTFVDVK